MKLFAKVSQREWKSPMRKNNKIQQGFTLLETVVVIGIMMIMASVAIFKSFGSMDDYKANSAMDTVVSELRVARQLAISQRRQVQVQFDQNFTGAGNGSQHILYQVQPPKGSAEVPGQLIIVALPGQTQFIVEPGVPDTPMGFGNLAPVYIGGAAGGPLLMYFNSTGTFTDSTGLNPINGTIFLGTPGQPLTARAVTIMGGTGRVRPYTYINTGWIE
jgi:type II secretory pathway pseudopilin PulG